MLYSEGGGAHKQNCGEYLEDTTLLNKDDTATMMEVVKSEQIQSVYELPNLEQVVRWYHAAAGYPTKATWIKAIDNGFYSTWPMLTLGGVINGYLLFDSI